MPKFYKIIAGLLLSGVFITPVHAQAPVPVPTIVQGETVFANTQIATFRVPEGFEYLFLDFLATAVSYVKIGGNDIKLPALSRYALSLYKSAKEPLSPYTMKTNTKDAVDTDTRPFEIAGRLCIYNEAGTLESEQVVSGTKMITTSTNPENTIEHSQASEQLSAVLARGSIKPKSGTYDFSQPEYAIDTANPLPCESVFNADTTTVTPDSSAGSNEFTFGPIDNLVYTLLKLNEYLGKKLHWKSYRVVYLGTTLNPGTARTYCSFVGCKDGSNISSVKYEIPEADITSGGASNIFRPHSLAFTDKLHGGPSDQDLDTSGGTVKTPTALSYADSLRDSAIKTYCMVLPKSLRAKVLGADAALCQAAQIVSTSSQCGAEFDALIDSFKVTDTSCKLCNASAINSYVDVPIPGGKLPPTFIAILEKAADTYKVPASLIIGTIYHEGAFSRSNIQWTEANVKKWSCGAEPITGCNKDATYTSQVPFGWIPKWFYAGAGTSAVWNAVQSVDPSRNSIDKVSPCNFMDGIFATAKALSMWSAGLPPDATAHNVTQCRGYTMTNSARPSSCSAWNDNIAAQSRVGYTGYCPDPGKHDPAFPDAQFIEEAITRYRAMKC